MGKEGNGVRVNSLRGHPMLSTSRNDLRMWMDKKSFYSLAASTEPPGLMIFESACEAQLSAQLWVESHIGVSTVDRTGGRLVL